MAIKLQFAIKQSMFYLIECILENEISYLNFRCQLVVCIRIGIQNPTNFITLIALIQDSKCQSPNHKSKQLPD